MPVVFDIPQVIRVLPDVRVHILQYIFAFHFVAEIAMQMPDEHGKSRPYEWLHGSATRLGIRGRQLL